ncbi:MAG TPA: hypothetical protein VK763_19025 [Terriglobales bacterium]|nr:hypothetical protein [Terriglobales bacterium]
MSTDNLAAARNQKRQAGDVLALHLGVDVVVYGGGGLGECGGSEK